MNGHKMISTWGLGGGGRRDGATYESARVKTERKGYEPLKAATTLLRSCERTDGGPPEDGGLDEG